VLSSCLSLYETVLSNPMMVRKELLYLTQKFVSDADDRGTIKITIREETINVGCGRNHLGVIELSQQLQRRLDHFCP
jgi:hypothetical protein